MRSVWQSRHSHLITLPASSAGALAEEQGASTCVRHLTGGPPLGEGPDYNTGASQQAVSAEPPPPGFPAMCMLKPTCIPFKYYKNQSRQGFNMATESKHTMRISSRGDVEALTAGLQHGFNMASTWPHNPAYYADFHSWGC